MKLDVATVDSFPVPSDSGTIGLMNTETRAKAGCDADIQTGAKEPLFGLHIYMLLDKERYKKYYYITIYSNGKVTRQPILTPKG